mmetsp:Transcript_29702/g.68127  ORF Transcript_29702/g.68127 Transcript_29702/m.68127 type:complete len:104 (+) Transcript_29702:45-356(+)
MPGPRYLNRVYDFCHFAQLYLPRHAAVTAVGNKVFDKALFDTAVPRSCYAWQMCGHCDPATCKMMAYGDPARRLADYPRTHALGCVICAGNADHLAGSHATAV